jgi:hypothetical protein
MAAWLRAGLFTKINSLHMKRTLLIIFSLFITSLLSAQKQNILDSTNVWQYQTSVGTGDFYIWHHFERIYYGADTIINTDTCRRIYRKSNNYREDMTDGRMAFWGTSYYILGYMSQDTALGKVFFIDPRGNRIVLYDFSRQVGDYTYLGDCRFTVVAVDTLMMNSVPHRIWEYDYYDTAAARAGSRSFFIIEGIGSTLNFFEPFYCYGGLDYGGIGDLHCFTNNGSNPVLNKTIDGFDNTSSCLLTVSNAKQANPLQLRVVPNPATTNSVIEFPGSLNGHIAVYDITGRLIAQQQLSHAAAYSLAGKLPCSGLYSYRLITTDGMTAAGKFVYE